MKVLDNRVKATLVVMAVAAGLFAAVGPSSADNHTLQVTPELGKTSQGGSGQVLTAVTTDATNGEEVHFEVISGPGEPATGGGTAGDSPLQPDYRCDLISNRCSVTIASAIQGTTLVRAWINLDNTDAAVDADSSEGRLADKSVAPGVGGTDCATEGNPGSTARTECEAGLPAPGAVPEPDHTDVVQITFVQAPTILDCDTTTPGTDSAATDDKKSYNFSNGAPVTCTAYNPQMNPVPGVRIDGENMPATGSVNDPDNAAANPADYFTGSDPVTGDPAAPFDFCVTGANGSCTNEVPASEGQQGTADVCFWIDGDNDYDTGGDDVSFASAGSSSDGGHCANGTTTATTENWDEAEKNDVTDKVQLTWNNTTATTTTSTTTGPTTTTTSTSTTSTSTPSTSTTSSTTTTTIPPGTAPNITTGAGPGGGPHIRVFKPNGQDGGVGFMDGSETAGKRVARGDLDGDGVDEIITGSGFGAPPNLSAYSATGQLKAAVFAYAGGNWFGGVYVAVGNVDNDPADEIITSVGPGGGTHIRVWDFVNGALTGNNGFMAYNNWHGGATVGTGDVNNDGKDDIITGAGAGGGPHVRVFNAANASELFGFMAFDNFNGGVSVAGGNLDGDANDEIVVGAGPGGGPHLKLFNHNGVLLNNGIMAGDANFRGGINVAAGDLDNVAGDEIVVGSISQNTNVRGYKADLASMPGTNFLAYPGFGGGVWVAVGRA